MDPFEAFPHDEETKFKARMRRLAAHLTPDQGLPGPATVPSNRMGMIRNYSHASYHEIFLDRDPLNMPN